jgi:hypothetical protein
MKVKIAYLQLNKWRRYYNDQVRRKLESLNIPYEQVSVQNGYRIMVDKQHESQAARAILSIPLR